MNDVKVEDDYDPKIGYKNKIKHIYEMKVKEVRMSL